MKASQALRDNLVDTEKEREYKLDFSLSLHCLPAHVSWHRVTSLLEFDDDCRNLGCYYCRCRTIWPECSSFAQKRDANLKILILEGKDRVGGRTVSKDIPAANGVDRWDFGGQWVGRTQTHILELIKELDLETYKQFHDGKKVYHMGGPGARVRTYTASIPTLSPLVIMDLTQFLWKIDRLCAKVCVQDPSKTPNAVKLDSMTLHTYIEQHGWTAELREEISLCSRSVFGMEPSQMSFLFFLMYAAAAGGLLPLLESTEGAAQEFKIKGGTQQLSECLAERLGRKNVRLGSAVTAIW
ncbi:hypothetical protein INR49_023369, partial [Caranx melampygus]